MYRLVWLWLQSTARRGFFVFRRSIGLYIFLLSYLLTYLYLLQWPKIWLIYCVVSTGCFTCAPIILCSVYGVFYLRANHAAGIALAGVCVSVCLFVCVSLCSPQKLKETTDQNLMQLMHTLQGKGSTGCGNSDSASHGIVSRYGLETLWL